MPTIYAAMLELDNRLEFQGIGTAGYDAFDNAATTARELLNRFARGPGDIKLFLAPEYTFAGREQGDAGGINIQSLSRSDKHSLYTRLKRTSAANNGIVIIAGSIAYSRKKWFKGTQHLAVCPVLLNGEFLLKYYKATFDGFQVGATEDSFTSKEKGQTFTVGGVNFGIEICSDHRPDHRILRNRMAGTQVDAHIIVSEGMAPSPSSIAARQQGLVINCDMSGRASGNGVRTVGQNRFGNIALDAAARGRIDEAEAAQAMANGAHIALYRGTLT